MHTKISATPNGVIIEVPAEGEHLGRNGWCHIKALELTVTKGKCSLTTINSRGSATNGELTDIPIECLLELLKALEVTHSGYAKESKTA
jgi:hypothetical protein